MVKRLVWLNVSALFLAAGCQSSKLAIVRNGSPVRHKTPVEAVATGHFFADKEDPDYELVADAASMCWYVHTGPTDPPGKIATYHAPESCSLEVQDLLTRWERLPNFPAFPQPPVNPRRKSGFDKVKRGLVYDVWVTTGPARPRTAMIVFRGTDFSKTSDWYANTNWLTHHIPGQWDQYEQVADLTPRIIDSIERTYGPDVRIFGAGHSLGGGLVRKACYVAPQMKKIFAFDPSPVSGIYVSRAARAEKLAGKTEFIAYESGEILSVLRVRNKLRNQSPDMIRLRYNFMPNVLRAVRQHDMQRFASSLRSIRACSR